MGSMKMATANREEFRCTQKNKKQTQYKLESKIDMHKSKYYNKEWVPYINQ